MRQWKKLFYACLAAAGLLQACGVGNRTNGSSAFRQDRIQNPANAVFYSDLGPDSIDVSSYPEKQKENYAVFARACYQCHNLARSINAPVVSPAFWEFYLLSMRTRTKFSLGDAKITKEESRRIVDFLEYDSNARKTGRKKEFDALTEELKARFQLLSEERLRRLQEQKQPKILPRE